ARQGPYPVAEHAASITAELKEAWWPDRKQRQHSKELAFLINVPQEINYWAAEKYGNARGAQTKAERDIAERRGLSVDALRKRLERYRARLRKRKAALEQQRKRPLRKVGTLFRKKCP